MSVSQLTILQDLPIFSSNPKINESFTPDISPRVWVKPLENYFSKEGIKDDDKKLTILFSLNDTKKGDAIQLLQIYSERKGLTFDQFRTNFLGFYPSMQIEDIQAASKNLLELKLWNATTLCAITNLENATRAVVDAYLNNEALTNKEVNKETTLKIGTATAVTAATMSM